MAANSVDLPNNGNGLDAKQAKELEKTTSIHWNLIHGDLAKLIADENSEEIVIYERNLPDYENSNDSAANGNANNIANNNAATESNSAQHTTDTKDTNEATDPKVALEPEQMKAMQIVLQRIDRGKNRID